MYLDPSVRDCVSLERLTYMDDVKDASRRKLKQVARIEFA